MTDAPSPAALAMYRASTSNSPIAFVGSSATAAETLPTSTALRRIRLRTFGTVELDVAVVASEASVEAFDTVRCRSSRSAFGVGARVVESDSAPS